MELRHLQYFTAVAEAQNISRAARRLRITQPALSRQVRDLEAELGLQLFERGTRQLRLTSAGRDLVEHGQRVLREVDRLRQRALALQESRVGVLRVGATPQTLEGLFPAVMRRFARAYPGVHVELFEGHPHATLELIRSGELHLAVTPHQPERAGSRLLGTVPVLAFRRRAGGKLDSVLELRELADEQLLVLARGYATRDLFDAACKVAGIAPELRLESSAAATLLSFARQGLGVAIIPGTIQHRTDGLRMQRLLLDGTALEVQIAIQWNVDRFLPAFGESFVEELVSEAARVYARG